MLSKSPKSLTPPAPALYQEIAGTQFMLYVSTGWRGSKCANNVFAASIRDFLPDFSALSPQATVAVTWRRFFLNFFWKASHLSVTFSKGVFNQICHMRPEIMADKKPVIKDMLQHNIVSAAVS